MRRHAGSTLLPNCSMLAAPPPFRSWRLTTESSTFPATVDFSQAHTVVAGNPDPFPPAQATPGSTGEAGYSPLIQLLTVLC